MNEQNSGNASVPVQLSCYRACGEIGAGCGMLQRRAAARAGAPPQAAGAPPRARSIVYMRAPHATALPAADTRGACLLLARRLHPTHTHCVRAYLAKESTRRGARGGREQKEGSNFG